VVEERGYRKMIIFAGHGLVLVIWSGCVVLLFDIRERGKADGV
jgi:hypothetical protein